MNWKTTLAGVVSAIGAALAGTGVLPTPWGTVASLISSLALALLGYTAKDK